MELEVNDLLTEMREMIGNYAQEIVILKLTIKALEAQISSKQ